MNLTDFKIELDFPLLANMYIDALYSKVFQLTPNCLSYYFVSVFIITGLFKGTAIIYNRKRSRVTTFCKLSLPSTIPLFHTQSHGDTQNPKK